MSQPGGQPPKITSIEAFRKKRAEQARTDRFNANPGVPITLKAELAQSDAIHAERTEVDRLTDRLHREYSILVNLRNAFDISPDRAVQQTRLRFAEQVAKEINALLASLNDTERAKMIATMKKKPIYIVQIPTQPLELRAEVHIHRIVKEHKVVVSLKEEGALARAIKEIQARWL